VEFAVKLLRPTPSDGPLMVVARVVESGVGRAVVEGEIVAGGKVTATSRATFVEVKEGHPAFHRW